MSMDYIRGYYKVPAKRGGRVEYFGGNALKRGTITGARGHRILIRLDGDDFPTVFHPTWKIRYLSAEEANA